MRDESIRREIGERLKQARKMRGRSQRGFAEDVGMPLPSYRDYEGGKRVPGGEALRCFARSGIDTHWLLTGETVAHEAPGDYRPRTEIHHPATARLREVIAAIETALEETGRCLPAAHKADLIVALYELYAESGTPPTPTAVKRLLRNMP